MQLQLRSTGNGGLLLDVKTGSRGTATGFQHKMPTAGMKGASKGSMAEFERQRSTGIGTGVQRFHRAAFSTALGGNAKTHKQRFGQALSRLPSCQVGLQLGLGSSKCSSSDAARGSHSLVDGRRSRHGVLAFYHQLKLMGNQQLGWRNSIQKTRSSTEGKMEAQYAFHNCQAIAILHERARGHHVHR
jgi:hypothetical protein